jgi:chemotaxis protein methyltransferase CheR
VAAFLEAATGVAIRPERESVFLQALSTRMVARLVPSAREYVEFLQRQGPRSDEVEALAALLSVRETYFWRYAGQFLALQNILIPALIQRREPGRRSLRLWSAGCASGEEVYSIVMACLDRLGQGWDVEVVGTDIHRPSLARADTGVYRARALRNLPPHLREKYLDEVPGGAKVTQALRCRAQFEFLNLGSEDLGPWIAQNGPFDGIFCRNTLIYFDRPAAEKVIERFESGLVEGGGLFLGSSEPLPASHAGFEPVRGMGSFFYRRRVRPVVAPSVPAPPNGHGTDLTRVALLYEDGLTRLSSEDFQGAKRSFCEILDLCPEDARGHTGLAFVLANGGEEAEAAAHLEQASQAAPDLAETHYLSGLVAERRGMEAEALRHYRGTLERDDAFFMAHLNRAWILRRQGRKEAFLREMRSAFRILKGAPRVVPWSTGGVGWEALLGLVAEVLDVEGDRP